MREKKKKEATLQAKELRDLARRATVIASVVPEPQRSRALAAAAELEAQADELERNALNQREHVSHA